SPPRLVLLLGHGLGPLPALLALSPGRLLLRFLLLPAHRRIALPCRRTLRPHLLALLRGQARHQDLQAAALQGLLVVVGEEVDLLGEGVMVVGAVPRPVPDIAGAGRRDVVQLVLE